MVGAQQCHDRPIFVTRSLKGSLFSMNIEHLEKNLLTSRIVKSFAIVFLLCVSLMIVGLLLQTDHAQAQQSPIVFNEVVSINKYSLITNAYDNPDWIELVNQTSEDISLEGYILTDKLDEDRYVFGNVVLAAGDYLVIYAANHEAEYEGDGIHTGFGLSKNGETLYLIDPQKQITAQLTVPPLSVDVSYARRDDGSYGYCWQTTPGAANNAAIIEKDAFEAMLQTDNLMISEVLPRTMGDYPWVELCNMGDTPVFIGNCFLSDRQTNRDQYRLPAVCLEPNEYLVVYLSGLDTQQEQLHASFELAYKQTGIYLFDDEGRQIDSVLWHKNLPYETTVLSDGSYTFAPTMGYENSDQYFEADAYAPMNADDAVRISEVLQKNMYSLVDKDGDCSDWVELHNSSAQSVSLQGYFLSDDKSDLFKWAFPDINIEAGGYLIVFLSGKQSDENELHASFRLSADETLYLLHFNGLRVDALGVPDSTTVNASIGKDADGNLVYFAKPTPASANAAGYSSPSDLPHFDENGIYISEVCAASKAKSSTNDWIELFNGSDETVDLTGYYLSDSANDRKKWRIPSLSIGPKSHVVIEAASDPWQRSDDTASFGISPAGETLLLCDADGSLVDFFETGVLQTEMTSGRIEGNSTISRVYFDKPTRGQANAELFYTGYASTPGFSESGLYKTEEFALSIDCATPQSAIYYTTDGSVPTKASKAYTEPITISKNTSVRAVAYADGLLPSEAATTTFLFEQPHTVPVFCIVGHPAEMRTILTTRIKNRKPEFAAHVEYYEADGTLGVAFASGVRPKGQSSLQNPQKSLVLRLRGAYGRKDVSYPFFEDGAVNTFTTLALRNAGQDNRNARLRDSYFARAVKGLNVDTMETKTVVAYVNGVYCGVYDLNEEQNADYLASHFGLHTSNIDMIDRNDTVMNGESIEYVNIRRIARTWNMRDDDVFAAFAAYVDVDACTDYLITQIYFGNGDVFNQRFWRARDYSVKWRPILFDLDWGMRFSDPNRNSFARYFSPSPVAGNGLVTHMDIFCALRKNQAWCDSFVERFVALSVTQFDTDRLIAILDDMVADMQPEMGRHVAKWRTPSSMAVWESEVAKLKSALIKRQDIVLKQLQRFFRVSDETINHYKEKYKTQDSAE